MLDRFTPFHQLTLPNPIFTYQSRRLIWGRSLQYLKRRTLWFVLIISFILIGLWVGAVTNGVSLTQPDYYFYGRSGGYIGFLLFISIAADVLLDFSAMTNTVGSFNSEITAGRWDLLRLSLLPARRIAEAKHTLGQLRSWRMLILIMSTRFVVVLLFSITTLLTWTGYGGSSFAPSSTYLIDLLTVVIFGLIYLIEPLWRLRAMTALGLVLSARLRNPVTVTLGALGTIFTVWISQFLVLLALVWFMSQIIFRLFYTSYISPDAGSFFTLFACGLTAATIYFYYRILKNSSLRYVTNWVIRSEGT